jgi:hypothetical protein
MLPASDCHAVAEFAAMTVRRDCEFTRPIAPAVTARSCRTSELYGRSMRTKFDGATAGLPSPSTGTTRM